MVQAGFAQNNAYPCDFTQFEDHAVYVDDLILLADVIEDISELKSLLSERFKIKDMGQLHYYLGVNVIYGNDCIWLHQNQYSQCSKKFGIKDGKLCLPQQIVLLNL